MLMGTLYKRSSFFVRICFGIVVYIPHKFGVKQNWFIFERSLTEEFLLFEVSSEN
jgi:hypothetical protein